MEYREPKSITIRELAQDQAIEYLGHNNKCGDERFYLYRLADGRCVIETSGEPAFDYEDGFEEMKQEVLAAMKELI